MGSETSRLAAALRVLALLLGVAVCAPAALAQQTILVTTNVDENNAADIDDFNPAEVPAGAGRSLREAISMANLELTEVERITIAFDGTVFLPNSGTTITLGSALPAITRGNLTIDGEVDDNGLADVTLNCNGTGPGNGIGGGAGSIRVDVDRAGIEIAAAGGDVTIEGISFQNGRRYAPFVWIHAGSEHRVVNCNFSGGHIGVLSQLAGGRCFIGSLSPGSDNSFANHSLAAVICDNIGAASSTIVQNGSFPTPNGAPNGTQTQADLDAVIDEAATIAVPGSGNDLIGGTAVGAANSFTGTTYNHTSFGGNAGTYANNDTRHAVSLEGTGNTTIQQCDIVQYVSSGIHVSGTGNNLIGGSTALAGNTLRRNGARAGNWFHAGIYIAPSATGTTTIQGNQIGTDDSSTSTGWVNLSCECNDEDNDDDPTCKDFDFGDSNVDRLGTDGNCGGSSEDEVDEDGNGGSGIFVDAPAGATVQIGGPAAAAQNIIYGNGRLYTSESKSGIEINGDATVVAENNLIGCDADGQVNGGPTDGNVTHGVNIVGDGNSRIGGLSSASRNIISGNNLNGVRISGGGSNQVLGNYVGLLPDGSSAPEGIEFLQYLNNPYNPNPRTTGQNPPDPERTNALYSANRVTGILVEAAASGSNLIRGNVCSVNGTDGVTINGAGQVTLTANYIGLDAGGTLDRGNGRHGVAVSSNSTGQNTIGGAGPGLRNVISGNNQFGISIEGSSQTASANEIQNNFIGLAADASAAVGNNAGGIAVNSVAQQTIGGAALGEGNVISGNNPGNAASDGVELAGSGDHVVLGNIIGAAPTDLATFPQPIRLRTEGSFANGGAGILLDASATGDVKIGFVDAGGGNVTVNPNYVVNNNHSGIEVAGSGTSEIIGNRVGVGPDSGGSMIAMPNADDGILLSGSGNNTVGRLNGGVLDVDLANVVSGNADNGISVPGGTLGVTQTRADSTVNIIQGNLIGTNTAGNGAVGNGTDETSPGVGNGLAVTTAAFCDVLQNVVSGNVNSGVYLFAAGDVIMEGNTVGLSLDGTLPLANGRHGVYVPPNATGTLVLGGAAATQRNIVAGNGDGDGTAPNGDEGDGVHIEGNTANSLTNNHIGTTGTGAGAAANARFGVYLETPVGVTTSLVSNVISGNADDGVRIESGRTILNKNHIGVSASGNGRVANGGDGVEINDGTLPGLRQGQLLQENVISGNAVAGIRVAQGGGNAAGEADDIRVFDNVIGLSANGLAAVGNGDTGAQPADGHGVIVEAAVEGKVHVGGDAANQGNVLSGNAGWGLRYESTSFTTTTVDNQPVIYGNLVGTNAAGAAGLGNDGGGIYVETGDDRAANIGVDGAYVGRTPTGAAANVIADNGGPGIRVADASGVLIAGNFIGTNVDGSDVRAGGQSLGNTGNGIQIDAAVDGAVVIGGLGVSERNLVSANGGLGINVQSAGDVTIEGNLIGAREPAEDAYPAGGGNAAGGIQITGGGLATAISLDTNVIRGSGGTAGVLLNASGATATIEDSTISDSLAVGVSIVGSSLVNELRSCTIADNGQNGVELTAAGEVTVLDCTISGNGASGSNDLEEAGVLFNGAGDYALEDSIVETSAQDGVFIVADGARVGLEPGENLLTSGQRNVIRQNGRHGVVVSSGQQNRLSGNRFADNGGIPIDLVDAGDDAGGVTLNDNNDTDAGPNSLLNTPVLEPLVDNGGGVFEINGQAPGAQIVQIFEADDDNPRDTGADVDAIQRSPLHRGEVLSFLGQVNVGPGGTFTLTTGSGDITNVARPLVTAIAIAAGGNTSEFARNSGLLDTNNSGVDVAPSVVAVDATNPGVATVTVTVVDVIGTPVPDFNGVAVVVTDPVPAPAVLEVTPALGTEQTTDANGQITATALARSHENCPDLVTFSATVNGTPVNDTADLTLAVGEAQASLSTIEVAATSPANLVADGRDEGLIEITIFDNSDPNSPGHPCPVPGVSFEDIEIFEVNNKLSEADLVQPNEVTVGGATGDDGKAFARVKTVNAGPYTLGFRLNGISAVTGGGVPITCDLTFAPNMPDPDDSTLVITAEEPLLANGVRSVKVDVTLIDAEGQPIRQVRPEEFDLTVAPADLADGVGITGPLSATDAAGTTDFSFTSNEGGEITVTVTIVREDGDGNAANNPSVTLTDEASAIFQAFFSQNYGPGLHMMGVSGNPVDPSPGTVLAPLAPDIKLARWNPVTESYDVFTDSRQAGSLDMIAGRGFWLLVDGSVGLTIPGEPTDATTVDIPLQQGWNQVANPFVTTWDFDLESIEVLRNGTLVGNLAGEAAQALLEPYGWRWDPVLQYLLVLDPDTAASQTVAGQLTPGRAMFWLCNASGVTVRLHQTAAARSRARAAATPGNWLATLEATTTEGGSQGLFGASDSRLRAAIPPQSPQARPVSVEFRDTLGRAATDVRTGPFVNRQVWTVDVVSSIEGEVTLSWKGLGRALPEGHRIYLVDPNTGRRVAMNSRSAYTYEATRGTRQFQIELEPRGEKRLNITDFNPGVSRGRGRGLGMSVSVTAEARLVAVVRGAGGRIVRRLEAYGQVGANSLDWDGRDANGRPVPAGTYQIEITAQDATGELARATRTVILN